MYYIGMRDGQKEKWKKKAKINHSILVYFPTIYLAPLKVYKKLKTLALIGAETSATEIFTGERAKKRNGKQDETDSLLHNTSNSTQHLYQISKSQMR